MSSMVLGMKVRLVQDFGRGRNTTTLRNVTEIHYRHNPLIPSVAFESDIHGTGLNCRLTDVVEFETALEIERADNF